MTGAWDGLQGTPRELLLWQFLKSESAGTVLGFLRCDTAEAGGEAGLPGILPAEDRPQCQR